MLPDGFQLSQSKLQDYVECPRRFQLRHILMQPWPALIVEPAQEAELHMIRGAAFHHLAHQHALGLDPYRLAATIDDPVLARWWETYLERAPSDLPEELRHPEVVVTMPLDRFRLVAKLDLVAVQPGKRVVVVDWKTVQKRPPRVSLGQRLQTRVYRFLAVESGAALNGGQRPKPNQIQLIYWFAQSKGATEQFPYSDEQHADDQAYLTDLIREIADETASVWPLTPDERKCRLCNYRSLCDRGVVPGFVSDLDDDLELPEPEIELEQIAEIVF